MESRVEAAEGFSYEYSWKSGGINGALACCACPQKTEELAPGAFRLNLQKSVFYEPMPPESGVSTKDVRLSLKLNADKTFVLEPFESRGTWHVSKQLLELRFENPIALWNSYAGMPLDNKKPLNVVWQIVNSDTLSWRPASLSKSHPGNLELVFTRARSE